MAGLNAFLPGPITAAHGVFRRPSQGWGWVFRRGTSADLRAAIANHVPRVPALRLNFLNIDMTFDNLLLPSINICNLSILFLQN